MAKCFKFISVLLSLCSLSFLSSAKTFGEGIVKIGGEIIDTPCAISSEDFYQTIEMPVIPISHIRSRTRDNGAVEWIEKKFHIRLINCDVDENESFQSKGKVIWNKVSFEGEEYNGDFKFYGDAKGVSLRIYDDKGNKASPGVALPRVSVNDRDNTLNFKLTLADNKKEKVPGAYYANIRFRIDYD
ncbi:fimbrial protein [Enterobacter kobei]|uniref:fimbrial protein n=1 Tax=Enterobacter kobei TaxID=208224 RepID=UPI002FD194A3